MEPNKEEQAVKIFTEFITKEIGLDELANSLDEIMWKLTMYMVDDPEHRGHPGRSDDLYYIRKLRDICSGKPTR